MANLEGNYWQAVRRAAEDVLEYPEDEREEQLDSWAESYTIYTSDSLRVLSETDNDDAVLEVYGVSELTHGIDSVTELYGRIAWFAVREDIRNEMAYIEERREREATGW